MSGASVALGVLGVQLTQHAECPEGMVMTGMRHGFGALSVGSEVSVLRRLIPICRELEWAGAQAPGPLTYASEEVEEGGFAFAPPAGPERQQTVRCPFDQIVAGLEARALDTSFWALDARLHCVQLELDASGRIVPGERTSSAWLNEGACQALRASASAPPKATCRTLGGPCPAEAPLPWSIHVELLEEDGARRPGPWQATCHAALLER